MAVRYRPKGADLRPGTEVVYVFQNEVTRAKGIPTSYTPCVVTGVHNGQARLFRPDAVPVHNVMYHDATDAEGRLIRFTADIAYLQLPGIEEYLFTGQQGVGWRRPRQQPSWETQSARWHRDSEAWPYNPELLERAITRFGNFRQHNRRFKIDWKIGYFEKAGQWWHARHE
jgi:hypothetical protein